MGRRSKTSVRKSAGAAPKKEAAVASDITGTTYQPSEIVLQCKKVFKNIIAYDKFDFDGKKESMYAIRPAIETVADMIGKGK